MSYMFIWFLVSTRWLDGAPHEQQLATFTSQESCEISAAMWQKHRQHRSNEQLTCTPVFDGIPEFEIVGIDDLREGDIISIGTGFFYITGVGQNITYVNHRSDSRNKERTLRDVPEHFTRLKLE